MTSVLLPSCVQYCQSFSTLMQSTGYSEQYSPKSSFPNEIHTSGLSVLDITAGTSTISNDADLYCVEQSLQAQVSYADQSGERLKKLRRSSSNSSTPLSYSPDNNPCPTSSKTSYSRSHSYSSDCYSETDMVDLSQLGEDRLSSMDVIDSVGSSEQQRSPSSSVRSVSSTTCKPLYTAELQVLCRICGDRASGFHYGVHSCEGCKGFFRRTLKKKLVYKPCRESSKCRIDTGSRNKCQYCRYQKCINAGMSQDAVRFGRMPKTEREKLQADKEELDRLCSKRILDLRSLSDTIKAAFLDGFDRCTLISNYLIHKGTSDSISMIKCEPGDAFCTNTLDSNTFHEQDVFLCFQEIAIPVLEGTVKFAKKIPSFSSLTMSEQIALMKQNSYCVTVILLHVLLEDKTIYLNGKQRTLSLMTCQEEYSCWEAECLFEGLFSVARRLSPMHLTVVEVALFSAVVLLMESSFLESKDMIEDLQMELLHALRLELKHNHPKENLLFARLLVLIPQLVQNAELFRQNLNVNMYDLSEDFSNTHPLFLEIFELKQK